MKKSLSSQSKQEAYWSKLAERIEKPTDTKNKRPDTTDIELSFIKEYCDVTMSVLDLGSGSGLIINALLPFVKDITAVEKFEGFSKYICENENMYVINADLIGFKIRRTFDLVLCTGVAQCFEREVFRKVYENAFEMTAENGIFVARTHCGIKEDVKIDGYSDELGTDYFAEYRQLDSEVELIKESGFSEVEVFDFLPDSINVWENTRHYYFVCKK